MWFHNGLKNNPSKYFITTQNKKFDENCQEARKKEKESEIYRKKKEEREKKNKVKTRTSKTTKNLMMVYGERKEWTQKKNAEITIIREEISRTNKKPTT